ncbi:XRE family transcriptional regulator [Conexibacter sp. JD483]|uniref:helix-turn-helix domain-containing protein n=1 Tax=unclassified Conexibacter TaxID=2627773 RepID=UPI00271916C1|nr:MULTISPECIES: XRE family transcriptional regulator [unclassified Conexibacter]MDO8189237.1 XRE family transcriptional regulator [Conexibacter sp. CPCC 205706]MDO8198723.1 XRE family transcriptional regulator [Conexibacter sp. CPCC 205762]MDR9372110.1 XRE family transcriptional regulator [Conexibacter sp. JD483]
MTQESANDAGTPLGGAAALEEVARRRLRTLRKARGWSLDELGRRTHIGPSTLSRLESGRRRIAIDHLVALARALDTTVEELVAEDEDEDVVIRPRRDQAGGSTFWLLTRPDDPSGRVVVKMRLPARRQLPETRVHPGRDWFYVLEGTVRLRLGGRELLVAAGNAAAFDTMTPHSMGGHGGPAEILSILDHHGERAHLHG